MFQTIFSFFKQLLLNATALKITIISALIALTIPDSFKKSFFSLEDTEWKIFKNTICELFRIRTHQPIEPEIYVCNRGLRYPKGTQFSIIWKLFTWIYFYRVVKQQGALKSVNTLLFILFALYRTNFSIYLWILCFAYRMFANNSLMNLVSTASIPLLFLPLLYTKPEFDVDQLFTIVYFNVLADVPKRSLISTVTAAYLATGSYQVMFFTFIFGIAVKSLIGKINSVLSYNCVDLLVRFCISNDVNQADFVILHNENPNATALGQQQGEGDNQNLDQLGDEITDITGLNLDVNIEIEMNRGRQTETTDVQEPEIPENDNIPQNQENQENNTTNLNEEEEYEEEEDQVGVINMNNAGTVQDFNKLNSQLKESVIILVSLSVISGLMLKFQNNRMKHITYMLLQFYFAPFLQAHKIFLMFYHDKVFYLWRHVFLDLLLSIITHFASGATINFFLIFPVFFSPIMPNISINKAELDKLVNNQNNQ